jgi:DNA-binding SARP family transcriptional activator
MEFRILGPLELVHRGTAVPIRGSRVRALLAMLLVEAGEVVPADRLMEGLWGDAWPASGHAALRMRVSQLRRVLGAEGPPVVAKAPGYALRVAAEAVDAHRFARLVADARHIQDPREVAATLRRALALWRGPALAGVTADARLEMEALRLEELRSLALDERIETDLALGRHVELVAELQALLADEPLRERRRGQLMLALYRSGRQTEALAAYREGRDMSVRELGLEPAPILRDLESAILRQDPRLDLARQAAPATSSELKLVTVLVGEMDPPASEDLEQAVEVADRHRDVLVAAARGAGGRVETVAGDAMIVIFGAPVAQEDHSERALRAALAMRAGVPAVRIGIEAGPVVVDATSSRGRTVTVATALQRAAAPGAILVGERAATAARGAFELQPHATPAGLACRRLLGARAQMARPRAALVGRERELDVLRRTFGRVVAERRAHLVTVIGHAGVGKSRLAAELWGWLRTRALRRSGRCLAYGAGATYRPLADVLREHFGLRETDPQAELRRALGARPILGLTLGLDVPGDVHPLAAREQLHEAWVQLLSELARQRPVAVLIEDLHWAQGPLLELIERLATDVSGPLLLVTTARPDLWEAQPWWGRSATAVELAPLAAGDAARLLDDLAGRELAPELRHAVLERAEGNPFFLEELLASLVEGGVPTLPDSVRALLAARIDILPPAEKSALQAAAVVGRTFWRGAVLEMLGETPDYALLQGRGFIRLSPSSALAGEREFAFRHALTCEVAYSSLTRPVRGRMHAAFARWLEAATDGRDEHAATLAHHYAEAASGGHADRARAVGWLRRAAAVDMRRYELDGALAFLSRAVELASDPAIRAELWRMTARAHALRYDGDAFWRAMHAAIELTTERRLLGELYAELAFETATRAGIWRHQPARDLVDGWIERATALAEPASVARARALTARCYWMPAGSADAAREALRLSTELGDIELESYALDACAIAAFVADDVDWAVRSQARRFGLRDRIDDPDHLADIHLAPLTLAALFGDHARARHLVDRYDAITSGLTPHHRLHGVAAQVEAAELLDGPLEISALAPRVEACVRESRDTPCVRGPRALLVCALAAARTGDAARADHLEALAEANAMEGYGHVLSTPRLRLALRRGDLGTVERLLAEPLPDRGWHRGWLLLATHAAHLDALAALGRRAELEAWPTPPAKTYLAPFHDRALGIVRADGALLEQAADRFDALGLGWQAEQTRHSRELS